MSKDYNSYGQFCVDNPNASKEERKDAIKKFTDFTRSNDWSLFNPNYNQPIRITLFDDGNVSYKNYENRWFICGKWRGKVKLINIDNTTIINSISEWKIESI